MSSKSVPKSTLGPRGSIVLRAPPKPLVVEESTQNVVDLHAGAAAGSTAPVLAEGPSFFVLQSSTSLFAGVPHLSGKLDGEALQATFHTPTDIIFDENQQMFVADRNNARIRRINKAMKVSTIASISGGDGDIENFPHGLAFDHTGTLYILQSGKHHHIFSISRSGGVQQVAGADVVGKTDVTKGSLFKASFNYPRATGVDSQNRLYIVERGNNCVRRVDLKEKTVMTLLDHTGKPLDLLNPEGIVVDQFDDIYVADTGHHRILKISPREANGIEWNQVVNYCGKYNEPGYANGEGKDARLNRPTGISIDKQNHLWICDSGNNCVRMFSYRSELMFTVSGKGSEAQEKMYHNPTSIALTYDISFGAELAPTTPEEIANDPNHPLYYSYITPVVFVADSEAHCIKRIHTILIEPANALIDVFNSNEAGEAYPMHDALSYGVVEQRDKLMKVLLLMKSKLLQQTNLDGRLPIHIACLESATVTSGSISLNDTIKPMLRLAKGDSLAAVDAEGKTPLYYAMEEMTKHTANEIALELPTSTPDVPSPATIYSRALISYLLMIQPSIITHACIRSAGFGGLTWLMQNGFGLKVLKKVSQAYEDADDGSGAPAVSPFLLKDPSTGRLPLHIAASLSTSPSGCAERGAEMLTWLMEASARAQEVVRVRDTSVAGKPGERLGGHYPAFYACTVGGDSSACTPLYHLTPTQSLQIETILRLWPQVITEKEGSSSAAGPSGSQGTQQLKSQHGTFLEWVFDQKAYALLAIFLTVHPSVVDVLNWNDDAKPGNMMTMLHCAARLGDADLLRLLLSHKANPFQSDSLLHKLPVDHATDPTCIQILRQAMQSDARRPKTPPPVILKKSIETQTVSGDSILESARAKLKNREAELKSEATRLAASQTALQKEMELERMRLKDREEALLRQAELERASVRKKSEQTLLAKTLELDQTKKRLEEELERERTRLQARANESTRAAETALAQARQKMEDTLRKQTEEALKREQDNLQKTLAEERAAMSRKQAELAKQLEADRAKSAKDLELQLRAASEKQLAQQQALLHTEVEAEKKRLKEREQELQRTAQHEEGMTRMRLESEYAAKSQVLTSTTQAEQEKLAAERQALQEKERELQREAERAREAARRQLEQDLKLASETALTAEQRRLREEHEREQQRLQEKEAQLTRELKEASQRHREQLEADLAAKAETDAQLLHSKLALEFDAQKAALQQRELQAQQRMQAERDAERLKADAELEAERRRLEASVAERMRQLDRERLDQQKRHEALEEQARLEREQAMKENARQVQLALEQEKDRLSATLREQTRSAEQAMEVRFREREVAMEEEKRRAEEQQRKERAEIQAAFEQRRLAMEAAERERMAALAKDDKDRRDAWERERAVRLAQEEADRLEQTKATQLDRAAALAADAARREAFAQQERERAARWEQEETQRQTARLTERAKFEEERAALMAQIEATKQRLEFDAAQRAASDTASRETARAQFDVEKAEYRRRMESAFDTEKKRLQQLAAEDARELMRKLEAEKAASDAARDSERSASLAALDRERSRLREEAEAKRSAEEARLAAERARMETERTRELERLENERRRLEDEREELQRATAAGIEARQTEAALKAAEEELAGKQRRAREAQELAAREERHAREIAARDASHQRRLAERESALREAEQRRLLEKAQRIAALEEDVERTRRELELQIAEKHATRRGLQEKVLKLTEVEDQLDKLAKMKVPPPPIRYTSNPLDVDPKDVPESDLPSVAHSIASFAKDFATMSFRSLLALLLSIPHSQLSKAQVLLRLYLTTHPGCVKRVDEPSGLLPLHLAAQAGLYRELCDIILREHPQALKTECRSGVYPIFYACAFRRQREERAAALSAGADGTPDSNIGSLLHADFAVDTVRRYNLELMKYFMVKFPDSIYLPNRLGGGEKDGGASESSMVVDSRHQGFSLKSGFPLTSNGLTELALKSGQQVDEFSPAASLSVVEYAFAEEDLELLTLLFELTSGDFLHAVDSCGRSYLHRAAMQGRLPTAQWLVEIGGVSPWQLCNADRTALEYVDPHKYEALALYLTRAMTAVPPEQRVKGRRGGRRMLIREWTTQEDGYGNGQRPLASRFIGAHDGSSPVRAATGAFLENVEGVWDGERMNSPKNSGWHGTQMTTPRGSTLRPVLRSKQKLPNGHMREEYEVLEGAGGNTTHIHVYPNQNGGLTNSRSLPSLLRSPHASPSSSSSSAAKKTPKSRQAEAEAEYAAFEAAHAAAAFAQQVRSSPLSKSQSSKGYHWQFLPPPKSSGQYSNSPARAFNFTSPAGSPARSSSNSGGGVSSPARSFAASAMRSPARAGGTPSRPSSAAVEQTVYSLQATTNSLQSLLNEANAAAAYSTPSRSGGYRR